MRCRGWHDSKMSPRSVSSTEKLTLLMEEYKLHKQEASLHLHVLYKQSSFIQLYGLVLLWLATLIYGHLGTINISTVPPPLRIASVIGAAILLFFLTSTV